MILVLAAVLLSQSVDDVVAKAISARGGIKRIKSLNSQRLSGRISLAGGSSGPFSVEMKRPNSIRENVQIGDKSMIRVTDGVLGWVVGSLRDLAEPQQLSAEELRNMDTDLEGPLVDYKAKGNHIELAGKEKLGKRKVYKLVISMKNGDNRIDYIDAKSFLELKWRGVTFETYFRDYREVKGLMYAFEIDSGSQKIVLDKVEVNPKLDDARFQKPQ